MKLFLRVLASIYAAYIALSVLVILPLLNFLPPWFVHKQYQRDLSMELVYFNPFALSLNARHVALGEAPAASKGAPEEVAEFASLDSAEVNLSLSSLWRAGWVLDALAVEGVSVHLRRLESGALNIDDFMQPSSAPPPEAESGAALPGVTVDEIRLSAHRIRVSDEARATPYTTHWDELRIRMSGLSTVVEADHPYHLRVFGESGGSLNWEGELSIPRGHSAGRIELSGIALRPFWRFVKDQVDFELVDGRLHVVANYRVDWSEGLSYAISDASVDIGRLDITPVDSDALPDTGIALGVIEVAGIQVDGDQQQVQVESLQLDGLSVRGWLEGERLSLAEMFNTRLASEADDAPADEPPAPWRVSLEQANIDAADIQWRSPFTEPARLSIEPLNVTVSNIQWPVETASPLAVDFTINESVEGQVDGALHLQEGDGTIEFNLSSLPLAWFEPNIPEILNARVESGLARSKGELQLAAFAPQQVKLEGAVEDFSVHLYQTEDAITRWKLLQWGGLDVNLAERKVALAQLHLDGYSGRVHIREDGTLNIQALLREDAQAQAKAAAEAGIEVEEEVAGEPWRFEAPAIAISDSEVDFMDESLPIHFRTVVGDVNGDITGLSSEPGESLAVDITGSVDGYAPVTLAGSASPFRQPPALDLDLVFQGVDLARLTPYSGTYAGYAIDRGTLNLNLNYSLAEDHLEGANKVVIQQLKLGEKVDSDKALDIPLKLGIALLTDASGVIDLAVPVSGDVNNPEFGLGSVIMGAFVNLITKAITAPFALLANLVGTDDDLQRINYPAGSAELDDHARQKLLELAEAMAQRPQIKLVIGGRLNLDTDRTKLQQQLLREALLAEGLTEEDIGNETEAWTAAIEARYAALPADQQIASESEEPPAIPAQARQLSKAFPVPAEAFKALGEERAAACKRFLVNDGGMAADRAVLEQTDPNADYNSFSGVEMSVDT